MLNFNYQFFIFQLRDMNFLTSVIISVVRVQMFVLILLSLTSPGVFEVETPPDRLLHQLLAIGYLLLFLLVCFYLPKLLNYYIKNYHFL